MTFANLCHVFLQSPEGTRLLGRKTTRHLDVVECLDCAHTVPPELFPDDTRLALLARDFVGYFFGVNGDGEAGSLPASIIGHINDYRTTVGIDYSNRTRKPLRLSDRSVLSA